MIKDGFELMYHPLAEPEATTAKLGQLAQDPESATDRALFEAVFDVFNTKGRGRWQEFDEIMLNAPSRLVFVGGPNKDDPELPWQESWVNVTSFPTNLMLPEWGRESVSLSFRLFRDGQQVTVFDIDHERDVEGTINLSPEQRRSIVNDLVNGNVATPLEDYQTDF